MAVLLVIIFVTWFIPVVVWLTNIIDDDLFERGLSDHKGIITEIRELLT